MRPLLCLVLLAEVVSRAPSCTRQKCLKVKPRQTHGLFGAEQDIDLPSVIDYRLAKDVVSPVKDQGGVWLMLGILSCRVLGRPT